ncbi:MAG: Crp/Fnr family transcriptional regulator [Cytophagales bacterium]|nr:MAG: Crp/Fnr family transcriptional regulator [Cytophagales bacterium]
MTTTAEFLKQVFDPFLELDIQVWQNFGSLGEVKRFSRETILKEANTTEKYISILISGSGGNLIWNKNNFVCVDMGFENDFLIDFMSFSLQKPTPIEVRLFEDSTIFRLSHQAFQQTFGPGNHGEKMTRLVTEFSYINKQQQQIDLLTKTAKERYIELLNTKKSIERTQLKYLASYLGITPQSLSRIRSEKI